MSTAANPISTFDPDEFHKQYAQRTGFDPDAFHKQFTSGGQPPDVFDQAAKGDIFDQVAEGPSNSLVTGNGMEQYARKQAAAAVRGPLDNAVSPGQRAPGEKPNPVSRFAEVTTGSPHPLDALMAGDLPAMATSPGRYAKNLAAAEIEAPARLAYSVVTDPIDTAVGLTGGPQFAEDLHAGRYGSAAGDVLGGAANTYGLVKGAESLPQPELPFDLPTKEGIAATFRTEKNALKPTVKAVGKLGGAATGGLIGHVAGPYGGYVGSGVGALAGPTILDAIIPNRPKAPELPPAELGSPENPGWVAPLPNRMPKPTASSVTGEKLPSVSIVPEPRQLFPGEDPGYLASVPRGRLPGLAAAGKPGAGKQLQQLGRTVLYVPPEGYPGPRVRSPVASGELGGMTSEELQRRKDENLPLNTSRRRSIAAD